MIKCILILSLLFASVAYSQTAVDLVYKSHEELQTGNFNNALDYGKQALKMASENIPQNLEDLSLSYLVVGQAYFRLGEINKAEEYMLEGLEATKGIKEPFDVIKINHLTGLAAMYVSTRSFDKCEKILNQAFEIFEKYPNEGWVVSNSSSIYNSYAAFCHSRQNYTEALHAYDNVINTLSQAKRNNTIDYAYILNNKAILLKEMGLYQEAEDYYKECIELSANIAGDDSYYYAFFMANIGEFYSFIGRLFEAETNFKKALEIKTNTLGYYNYEIASLLDNLGAMYLKMENYDEAEKNIGEALRIAKLIYGEEHEVYFNYLNNLATVNIRQKKYQEALKKLLLVHTKQKEILLEIDPAYCSIIGNLGYTYLKLNQQKESFKYYSLLNRINLKRLENISSGIDQRSKSIIYSSIYEAFELFYLRAFTSFSDIPDAIAEAYNTRISLKGFLLDKDLKIKKLVESTSDPIIYAKYEELSKLKIFVANQYLSGVLDSTILPIEDEIKELERELIYTLKIDDAFIPTKTTWVDIQSKLSFDEAAIEIIKYGDLTQKSLKEKSLHYGNYVALLIKKESKYPELIYFEDGVSLETIYKASYDSCRRVSNYNAYRYFWEPIAKKLNGKKKVFLSSDGIFSQINLNILVNPSTGKHLIDEIDLHLLSNTKDFKEEVKSKRIQIDHAELFGNADYDKHFALLNDEANNAIAKFVNQLEFPELPETKEEIRLVKQILVENNWTVSEHLKDNANEATAKTISNTRVLHFATHGYFLPDFLSEEEKHILYLKGHEESIGSNIMTDPLLRSGIVLSCSYVNNALSEDGYLTALEISNLNLEGTELVVLSGCKTGRAVITISEGVYGLQRAFKIAGAQSVIMSLWEVNDLVTRYYMEQFYQKWLTSSDKYSAFKFAIKKTRDKYEEPYNWGAFILVE